MGRDAARAGTGHCAQYLPAAGKRATIRPGAGAAGQIWGQSSSIPAPSPTTYLAVHLKAGESWRFEPPGGHTVAWTAVGERALSAPAALRAGDLAVFEESSQGIDFVAETDSVFMLGSATLHPHDLMTGPYSVHTTGASLRRGQDGIRTRAQLLREQGRL